MIIYFVLVATDAAAGADVAASWPEEAVAALHMCVQLCVCTRVSASVCVAGRLISFVQVCLPLRHFFAFFFLFLFLCFFCFVTIFCVCHTHTHTHTHNKSSTNRERVCHAFVRQPPTFRACSPRFVCRGRSRRKMKIFQLCR